MRGKSRNHSDSSVCPEDPTSYDINFPVTLTLPGPFPDFKFVNPLSGKVLTAGVTMEHIWWRQLAGTERTITTPTYTVTNTFRKCHSS